ncbi:MAG TPA: hypothetical protein VEU76_01285 [Candidatus Udaeobacter sp.]|nr:hypothetical protein [Candidatus Udaeobacter sp.]
MTLGFEGGDVIGINTMAARGWMRRANGTASVVLLRPMVVLAAKVMGPGPARLRMVKLAHNLGRPALTVVPVEEGFEGAAVQPTTRAA